MIWYIGGALVLVGIWWGNNSRKDYRNGYPHDGFVGAFWSVGAVILGILLMWLGV